MSLVGDVASGAFITQSGKRLTLSLLPPPPSGAASVTASSPLLSADRATFAHLPIAPYDAAWCFEVPLLPAEKTDSYNFTTGTDGIMPFELTGIVHIPGVGKLDVWRLASYGGGIFLPVTDALAGQEDGTYGGGRYLLDTAKGADLGRGKG